MIVNMLLCDTFVSGIQSLPNLWEEKLPNRSRGWGEGFALIHSYFRMNVFSYKYISDSTSGSSICTPT